MHSLQYLTVVTPNGLISCLKGAYKGRKGDWGMWKDGMQEVFLRRHETMRGIMSICSEIELSILRKGLSGHIGENVGFH